MCRIVSHESRRIPFETYLQRTTATTTNRLSESGRLCRNGEKTTLSDKDYLCDLLKVRGLLSRSRQGLILFPSERLPVYGSTEHPSPVGTKDRGEGLNGTKTLTRERIEE